MFDHLFENRNSTVTNLIKMGDCLGRSLRENVELFSIDSEEGKVAYLSESGKVITGKYDLHSDVSLNSIKIQDVDIFTDNETFDSFVNERVSSFIGHLNADAYNNADDSFFDILSLWENRLKFENVKKRLDEKVQLFCESQNILKTEEFSRFLDAMPQFLTFLSENQEEVSQIKEIENAIKLSNSISKAFNFPKLSYGELKEDPTYTIKQGINKSIYEMVCRRELVAKELIESKKGFEEVWATNPKIRNLAALIFEESEEAVLENLVEAVIEVPYLALATKKQIFESLDNALGLGEHDHISTKEIKGFASTLFDMKKPLKSIITDILNEKYGINVLNLKETPTFKSLANTQVVIFEALSRLAPKGSIIKNTLSEVAMLIKNKNGVEVIDVNDILQEAFDACNYNTFCEEYTLIENLDFNNILDNEATPSELLEKARARLLFDRDKESQKVSDKMAKDEATPENESDDEDDSVKAAEKKQKKESIESDETTSEDVKEETDSPETPPEEEKSKEVPDDNPMSDSAFFNALKDMDELMQDLSSEEEETQEKEAEADEREA